MTKLRPKSTTATSELGNDQPTEKPADPVTDTATTPSATADEPSTATGANSAGRNVSRLKIAAAVAAGFMAFPLMSHLGAGPTVPSTPTEAPLREAAVDTDEIPPAIAATPEQAVDLDRVLDAAVAYEAANGTFAGFTASGAAVAASDDVLIVSATISGTCLYSGILEGVRNAVLADPTGEACNPAMIAEAQAALDDRDRSIGVDAAVALSEVVAAIEAGAAQWAALNVAATGPSLAGLTLPFPEATVLSVSPDGRNAIVRAQVPNSCAIVTVDTAGTSTTTDC